MASRWVDIGKAAAKGYGADQVPMLAAALAFYAMFAIAPLMIIVIEIGAAMLGGNGHHAQVRDQILAQLQPAIGPSGTKAIAGIVQATFNQKHGAILAQTISWIVFAAAATGLLGSVETALDNIWEKKETGGLLYTILLRVKSFAIIAGVAIVMVALMLLTAWTGVLGAAIAKVLNAGLLIVVATAVFAVLYKWLPKTKISWRDVIGGAALTAVLSVVGQYLIGIYLGRATTTSVYGAAGSLAAILLWLYYSSMIFLIGAEITKAYANTFGSRSGTVRTDKGVIATGASESERSRRTATS